MLKFVLADRKKPPVPFVYKAPTVAQQPAAVNIELFNEARRRDNIIKELVKKLPYKVGDKVVPADPNKKEESATIVGICTTYAHLGHEYTWPKNDNPMIVTARKDKDGTIYFCTTNYLVNA